MNYFAILILCLTFQQAEHAAQEPALTAEAVIQKYVAAKGGKSALRKIKNYVIKGRVISGNEVLGKFESYQAASRHLSIDHFPDGTSRRHGTDGTHAWRIDVKGKPTLLTGQEARDYIRHYKTVHESLEWFKQFDAILYAGRKNVQDTLTNHLIFVASDNRQINRYFSVESGLLIREEQVDGKGKSMQILISEIGEYALEKNGTFVSRRRLNHFGSQYSTEYKIESIDSNTLSDESVFAMPDSILKLITESTK